MPITTRLTTLLGIQSPIVSAPMASAASPAMAAAVTGAGAFGFFGAGRDTSQQLRDGLRSIRKTLDIPSGAPVPAGVGFLGWILDRTEVSDDPRIPAYLEEMPAAIWFAFGTDLGKYITQVRAYDAKREHKTLVFVIVNSVEEALRATNEWKVDVLVVQGNEAGGHGGSYAPPLLSLLQAVLNEISNGPVIIAAGGITTGAQSAALLAMGADGVVIGSRLLCAPESVYSEAIKEEILKAGMNATARSYAFDDVNRTRYWPEGIDGRALANDILVDFDKGLDLDARLKNYDEAKTKGERSRLVVWAGVGIGFVKDKRDSATIIKEIHDEMVHTLQAVTRRISLKL
ncbi:hypothetical protein D9615_009693 [Tricholomella constricta]|uniref:Nitronate monooxygenase domain-containing protein n=1 Tax=Tricholomella constricta TaxID=117010 RepID=A0A8H5GUX4_9AGAR|nr:hypothetical protein D9615_009693 [Tricholomella constricta]